MRCRVRSGCGRAIIVSVFPFPALGNMANGRHRQEFDQEAASRTRVTGEIEDCANASQEDVMKLATQREEMVA